ncbi:MAG: hypothetical protein M1818_004682 [Claussenomyces sp. TS43310]|nr:MAG: hypothetical protein M1818_004682 [Claussenomyces sp. TS43310]
MAPLLPPDIMLLICEELGYQRDFGSLFNLAKAGKSVARSALLWIYRVHHQNSIRAGGNDQTEMSKTGTFKETTITARVAQQKHTVSRWALQWRSIILSSLSKTAYPYCLYIRSLDLTNLEYLLEDDVFKDSMLETFFSGDMETLLRTYNTPLKRPKRTNRKYYRRLNIPSILEVVGESISKYVSDSAFQVGGAAALEELSGRIPAAVLPLWVGRLSRLQSMTLWDGSFLNKSAADAIRLNCPDFQALNVWSCLGAHADADLAEFFSSLRPNSLRAFQVNSRNDIAAESFLALNSHRESLSDLRLGDIPSSGMKALSLLAGCTALETLNLRDSTGTIRLEATENDVFLEVLAWVRSCSNLKHIRVEKFTDGPSLLTSLCMENEIHLRSLSLNHYSLANNQELHRALTHQPSLESLELRADAEESFRDDIDTLISSICTLKELNDLNLLDTSDYFKNAEVHRLAMSLQKLKFFTIGGYEMNDDVWPALSSLSYLVSMSFHAVTSFTFEGILKYISSLKDTNGGLTLSIMCATMESDLSQGERAIIREAIAAKVDGKFEFVLFREAESDFSLDSD